MSDQTTILRAFDTLSTRLDTLRNINEATILLPGGPQERYHELLEEAYTAFSTIENEVDTLGEELEFQHKRLDDARDAALAEATQGSASVFVSSEPTEILEDEV
ncbi:MAG: hypothetical protein NVS4B12_21840 [Ktedonobacteraceae bacterium]